MKGNVRYTEGTAGYEVIAAHLRACDDCYRPALSTRVDIDLYSDKIARLATTFEAWEGESLIGLVAAYFNDPDRRHGFVTSVSVIGGFRGSGVASALMAMCIRRAEILGIETMALEVSKDSAPALGMYRKLGFDETGGDTDPITMHMTLPGTRK